MSPETLICAWCGKAYERPNTKGPAPSYCSSSHRQRAHEGRQLARMARVSELIDAASIPSELSKAVESFRHVEESQIAGDLKRTMGLLASTSAVAGFGETGLQDLLKNTAAQMSSPIVRNAMTSFASIKVPPEVLGIHDLRTTGLLDSAVLGQLASLPKVDVSAITGLLAKFSTKHSTAAALGAYESAALVKALIPDLEWIKALATSGATNAILAQSVGALSGLAEDIASTTAKFSAITLPKGKWLDSIDLGVDSWSHLVRVMPPQPSPRQLGGLSLLGTGALAVAETGLVLLDQKISAEDPKPSVVQRERFRATLMKLGPDLLDRIDGAWERVGRPGPDAASQAAHSLVEFIDWTLRRAAPDEAVLRWHKETQRPRSELNQRGEATRALKIRFIMKDRADESDSAEMQVRSLADIMKYLQKKKHAQGDKELQAVARLIPGIEAALLFILPWDLP